MAQNYHNHLLSCKHDLVIIWAHYWRIMFCYLCHRSSDKARWCAVHHEWRNATSPPAVRQRSAHYLLWREVSAWELDQSRQVPVTGAASAGATWGLDSRQCRRLRHAQIWTLIVLGFGICIISTSTRGIRFRWWRDGNRWTAVSVRIALNCYWLELLSSF